MMGAGISLAALGLSKLVESFKGLNGEQIMGALKSITAVTIAMGGLVVFTYAMIPALISLGAVGSVVAAPLLFLGASLFIVGTGLKMVSEGGKGVTELFKSLSSLDTSKLDAVAPSLAKIGDAVLSLGTGTILTAIGGLLGGKGPVGIIKELVKYSGGLIKTAESLKSIATSMTLLSVALKSLDVSKLKDIEKLSGVKEEGFFSKLMSKTPIGLIGSALGGLKDKIFGKEEKTTAPSLFTSPPTEIKTGVKAEITPAKGKAEQESPMVAAINEVREAVNKLFAKDTSVYLDGDKVSKHIGKNPETQIAAFKYQNAKPA